ncbi:MAG: TonB-dependent receptor [Terriglobia bacterium]|jgi:hypothetical protein
MKSRNLILALATVALFIVGIVAPAMADITGKVIGTVVDPTGAVVPGAKVTLRNPSTGLMHTTQTDTTGSYEFLLVPVGENYEVEVEAGGFRKAVQEGITLLVNQVYRTDFHLQIGSTTQSVEVSAEAAQVETTSTQLGDVIQSRKMETLPLNGRSYIDLMGLQAGVIPMSSGISMGGTVSGELSSGTVSVNGQRESSNAFLVNGGDVEHNFENGASIIPTLDSIQEFRLLTNSYDAEYGRFSGAIVNVVTKSGTNGFHGDLYDFVRNSGMDSRGFFDLNQENIVTGQEIPGSAVPYLKRNQFGGTIGGPIRKNRLFFFTDYQGTREVDGASTGDITVPSSTERQGDFSDVATTGYAPLTGSVRSDDLPGHFAQTLSSRLGYTVNPGEPYYVAGCNSLANAQAGMCVFPGQVIPQAAWSPAAAGTLNFIQAPTLIAAGRPYFSSTAYKGTLRDDKFAERIDLNTTRLGTFNVYYYFDDTNVVNPYGGGNMPGFITTSPTRAQQINLGNTLSPNPTTVNEVRINFTRPAETSGLASGNGLGTISKYGYVAGGLGIVDTPPTPPGIPELSLEALGISFGVPSPGVTNDNDWQVTDSVSKIQGRHTMKFGADFRSFADAFRSRPSNGYFSLSGSETGNDFADYLIGAPDSFLQSSEEDEDARSKYISLYAQDSFKIKSNFTLNYGLRWEVSRPWSDTQGRVQAFVPGLQSVVFPNSPTGWVFPGDPGIPSTLSPTRYKNFNPRLGLAYSPRSSGGIAGRIFGGPGRSSIRASFGIFHTIYEEGSFLYETGNPPFGIEYLTSRPTYLEAPFESRDTGANLQQPFPWLPPKKHTDYSFKSYQPLGYYTTAKTDNVLPYAEHFNFSFQREIGTSMTLTVAYVGTEGHHLLSEIEANPGYPSKCLQIRALAIAANEPSEECGPFGEDTIYNINGQVFNGTRPYSVTSGRYLSQGILDFQGSVYWAATFANSDYNSLQVTLEKKVGALRFLGAYTYGKSLDNVSTFGECVDPFDYRLSRALSAFDMTHNFVTSYSYDLPLQKFTRSSSGVVHKSLEGWTVSGITRFTTGLPASIYESGDNSLIGDSNTFALNGADLPDWSGQPLSFSNPRSSANHQYFSTAQFSPEVLGVIGTASRSFFHGPGLNNWDMSLHKTTRITERTALEFRAEFFDVFNHAQFNNPVGNFAASSFGQITSARSPRIGQLALKLNF